MGIVILVVPIAHTDNEVLANKALVFVIDSLGSKLKCPAA